MHKLYPLKFTSIWQDYAFGNRWLEEFYPGKVPKHMHHAAESWEIADLGNTISVIRNGPLTKMSLRQLLRESGKCVLGDMVYAKTGPRFPLLVKFLDASRNLELQVHPDDARVKALKSSGSNTGKTEAWYVIAADKGCSYRVGLRHAMNTGELRRLAFAGELDAHTNHIPIQTGDCIFVPAGRIHAIGARSMVFEIQQNSNLTGFFEWDRKSELKQHIEQALPWVNVNDTGTGRTQPMIIETGQCKRTRIFSCKHFELEQLDIRGNGCLPGTGEVFSVITVLHGILTIKWSKQKLRVKPGESCLVPACLQTVVLYAPAKVIALRSTVPTGSYP